MIELFDYVTYTTIILSVVLAIGLLIKYNELSSTLKVVGIYLIVGAAIDIVASALYSKKESNLVFLHLFTLFEIVIISYIFKKLNISLESRFNNNYIAIPATIFVIINSVFIQSIYIYNTYSSAIVSIIILAYCIHFFILILDRQESSSQFLTLKWFVICLFFFHSISLIIMLFGNLIHDLSREAQSFVWTFRGIIILATKIILTTCFIKLLFFNNNLKTQ